MACATTSEARHETLRTTRSERNPSGSCGQRAMARALARAHSQRAPSSRARREEPPSGGKGRCGPAQRACTPRAAVQQLSASLLARPTAAKAVGRPCARGEEASARVGAGTSSAPRRLGHRVRWRYQRTTIRQRVLYAACVSFASSHQAALPAVFAAASAALRAALHAFLWAGQSASWQSLLQ